MQNFKSGFFSNINSSELVNPQLSTIIRFPRNPSIASAATASTVLDVPEPAIPLSSKGLLGTRKASQPHLNRSTASSRMPGF